jgi:hypothetical protein
MDSAPQIRRPNVPGSLRLCEHNLVTGHSQANFAGINHAKRSPRLVKVRDREWLADAPFRMRIQPLSPDAA